MVGLIESSRQCRSPRPARVSGRCSAVCPIDPAGKHTHGYVPRDLVIGGGVAVHFRYCPNCGQIQGTFPVPSAAIEEGRY